MNITFYSGFKKRINSCKLPTTGTGISTYALSGVLKEPCSIEKPVIHIARLTSDASPAQYTYAHISDFNRYYFVEDWVWSNGRWECHLTEDYLASWRTDIGNSFAYVTRSSEDYNPNLIDHKYPTMTGCEINYVNMSDSWTGVAPSGGCYVMGVINNDLNGQAGGAVTYYVLSPSEMRTFMSTLLSEEFVDDMGFPTLFTVAQQLTQDVAKLIFNPFEYIVSCLWYPFPYTTIAGNEEDISLGWYVPESLTASAHLVNTFAVTLNVYGEATAHPQASQRGTYLNYAPFTDIKMDLPIFGEIPIDTSYLSEGRYIKGTIYLDVITGKAELRVSNGVDADHIGNHIITIASAAFGINIPLANLDSPYLGIVQTVADVLSSVAGANPSGAVSALLKDLGNAIDGNYQQRIGGTGGSFTSFIMNPVLTCKHYWVADDNNNEYGRPLCETAQISTLPGYIECDHVDIDFNCFDGEKRQIISYMQTGFFWE